MKIAQRNSSSSAKHRGLVARSGRPKSNGLIMQNAGPRVKQDFCTWHSLRIIFSPSHLKAPNARPPSARSSRPQNFTTSNRSPVSKTFSHATPIIPTTSSPSYSRRIGGARRQTKISHPVSSDRGSPRGYTFLTKCEEQQIVLAFHKADD